MRNIDYLDKAAELNPDAVAVQEGAARITFGELQAASHRIAAAMAGRGIKHQEPAAILSPNHAGVLLCLLGLWRAGAVWIPVNAGTRWTPTSPT